MCGISGIYCFSEKISDTTAISAMTDSLTHRGPDAGEIYNNPPIQLGHRRLSIIDLKTASNQPFVSSDNRYVLVFNGEIYNFLQLKSDLKGYEFKTDSDTEVVLAAFIRWGSAALERFDGMFAFAIWDNLEKKLFAARDRLGIKPFYFFQTSDQFIFSSEVRSLLKSGLVPKKLNRAALSDYLRYQTVHSPETMVEGIMQLPSGSFFELDEDGVRIQEYWKAEDQKKERNLSSPEKTKSEIKRLFFEAVEKRLIADVPFGAFLSGGIDSSAIVAAMSEVSSSSINTFSVVFEDPEYSEERYANIVAEKFKTNHTNVRLSAEDLLNEIPFALDAMDHPSGDGINTYTVTKATKEAGITVALSGLGGDELFSGYPVFRQMQEFNQKKWLQSWPKEFRKFGASMNERFRPSIHSQKIKELLTLDRFDLASFYPISRQLYFDDELQKLLKVSLSENKVQRLTKEKLKFKAAATKLPEQSQISMLEFYTYMQQVLLRDADQMSMAHALEIRVPFLDHHLVELALNISDQQKLSGFPKQLLVDSLDGLLPKEVYSRKKMGFVFPWKTWLKNELCGLVESNLDYLASLPVFEQKTIENYWKMFQADSPKMNWVKIWSLVVLSHWIQKNEIIVE